MYISPSPIHTNTHTYTQNADKSEIVLTLMDKKKSFHFSDACSYFSPFIICVFLCLSPFSRVFAGIMDHNMI